MNRVSKRLLTVGLSCLCVCVPTFGSAGYVSQNPDDLIVATTNFDDDRALRVLDRLGQVWHVNNVEGWVRESDKDVPFPVSEIRFWDRSLLITTAGELWRHNGPGDWEFVQTWPMAADVGEAVGLPPNLVVSPVPAKDVVWIDLSSLPSSRYEVIVTDVSGRVVRRYESSGGSGVGTADWDRREEDGRRAPAGVYGILVIGTEVVAHARAVIVN